MRLDGPGIVGREGELSAVGAFVAGGSGAATLVLEGDAGAGKTTIWSTGVDEARRLGLTVLVARPAQSEARFAFSSLGDLLEVCFDDVAGELPAPQRRALEVALLRDAVGEERLEEHLVGVGLLWVLRALAGAGRVVVAIDDVQWLDRPSATVLAFAGRRLRPESVRFLLTERTEPGTARSRGFAEPIERLAVGPLSLGALRQVVLDHLEVSFSHHTLRRLSELSGGNPFFALELARGLLRRGGEPAGGDELPIPTDLAALVAERLADLGSETREALLIASLLSDPTIDLLDVALRGSAWRRLEPAIDARVVEVDGSSVRFAHPLLAAVLVGKSDPVRRRELHRLLASIVVEPEQRARHLAASVDGPDEEIADELEHAAERARGRGAPGAAGELLRLAAELSGDPARGTCRRIAAGVAFDEAGDGDQAMPLVRQAVAEAPPGNLRAQALYALGSIAEDAEVLERAAEEAGADDGLRARVLVKLYDWVEVTEGPAAALPLAREAITLAERADDHVTLAIGLSLAGHGAGLVGEADAFELLERARTITARGHRVPRWHAPDHWLALQLLWSDELDRARPVLERELREADEAGDE